MRLPWLPLGIGLLAGCAGAHRAPAEPTPVVAELLNRGAFEQAVAVARQVHAAAADRFGEADPRTVAARSELAAVLGRHAAELLSHGHPVEAVAPAREAVALSQSASVPAGVRALYLDNLALALFECGKAEEAEPLFLASIAIRETSGQPSELANSLSDLGALYARTGRPDQAEALQRRALEIYQKVEGTESVNAAITAMALAEISIDRGQRHDAAARLEEALPVLERGLGIEDNFALLAKTYLASCYEYLHREEEAVQLLRQVMQIRESQLPDNPRELAITLGNLGSALRDMGKLEEAEQLLERGLAMDRGEARSTGPAVARMLVKLAQVREERGNVAEAEAAYREAVSILEREGTDPVDLAWAEEYLGRVLSSLKRYDEARETHERALQAMKQARGDDSVAVTTVLASLAAVAEETGDLVRAEELYRVVIDTRRRLLGPRHGRLVSPYGRLAAILLRSEHRAEALRLLDEAGSIAVEVYGPEHPLTHDAEIELAAGLLTTGDTAAGTELFEGLLTRVDATTEGGRARQRRLIRSYARAWRATGQESEAVEVERRHPLPDE